MRESFVKRFIFAEKSHRVAYFRDSNFQERPPNVIYLSSTFKNVAARRLEKGEQRPTDKRSGILDVLF